jgi:aquaporin Z
LVIGLIHLAVVPVTGTSVNPARSTGPALVALVGRATWPIEHLWVFWLASLVGSLLGAAGHGAASRGGASHHDNAVTTAG